MSINTFKQRPRFDVSISVSGSGQFWPFQDANYQQPISWSINGTVSSGQFDPDFSTKEITCFFDPRPTQSQYSFFRIRGSTGRTSGTFDLGNYADQPNSTDTNTKNILGTWDVNTNPVLSNFGKVDGLQAKKGFYVVNKPANKTVDDPIFVNPAIDYIARIYPGDYVTAFGVGTPQNRWAVRPQTRFPRPDRTFSWIPNSNPKLKKGGYVDGVLAKPGTIMLPTEDKWIDETDLKGFFYKNQGVFFNGQDWVKLGYPVAIRDETTNNPKFLHGPNFISSQVHEQLLEELHENKMIVVGNVPIQGEGKFNFTFSIPGGGTYTSDVFFRWAGYNEQTGNNIIPIGGFFYDHGDAYSRRFAKQIEWFKENPPNIFAQGFNITGYFSVDGEPSVWSGLYCDRFCTGTTENTEQFGQLSNTVQVNLSVDCSI